MNLKKKKFSNLTEFFTLFNTFNKNICLFTHINNSSIIELNQIKLYCNENNIKTKYIKIGLLKKLTKNPLLLNLLAGPTQLFFFDNIKAFYDFSQIDFIKKKIYPLSIYFNNNFFNYVFFYNYIKEKITNVLKKEIKVYDIFLYNITNIHKSLIIKLNHIINNFIINLVIILNKFR
jgi:hypothetical protein